MSDLSCRHARAQFSGAPDSFASEKASWATVVKDDGRRVWQTGMREGSLFKRGVFGKAVFENVRAGPLPTISPEVVFTY